jgi:hypothetical protein
MDEYDQKNQLLEENSTARKRKIAESPTEDEQKQF